MTGLRHMPPTPVYARIAAVYVFAVLNAVALIALLASSDAISGESSDVHHAYIGSVGWFGIGVLFSGAAVAFFHLARHYYGERSEDDLVRSVTTVAPIMSFLMFVLGIWESAPLIQNIEF